MALLRPDLLSEKKLSRGNTCEKKSYYMKAVSHLASSASTHVKPSPFTKTKVIFRFSQLSLNYLFSLLFTQRLSKVLISISGRKTGFAEY